MNKKKDIKRSKTPGKKYFDETTQEAIIKFQEATTFEEKHEIYKEKIMNAFEKLVENLIFIYNFSNADSVEYLKNDCVSFLYETLGKFNASKGTKAFSYFNVVARNYLIIATKNRQKRLKQLVSVEDLQNGEAEAYQDIMVQASPEELITCNNKIGDIKNVIRKIKLLAKNENEKACMEAIDVIFDQVDDLEILGKRAIHTYMRDLSGLDQKKLGQALASIRKYYKRSL